MANTLAKICSPIEALNDKEYRLIVFDLSILGHHPGYIKHLIHGWCRQKQSGELLIVVSPLFFKEHSDVTTLSTVVGQGHVKFIAITEEEEDLLRSRKSGFKRFLRAFQEWNLLCRYAQDLQATECFLPYFDTFRLPLIFGKLCPCPVSGIYFRPTFHYPNFSSYQPGVKDRLQHWRERFIINRVLSKPQLHTLFSLDPVAVDWLRLRYPNKIIVALPDPIELQERSPAITESLRSDINIEPQRKVLLLFGAITERKGIFQLLDAIALLPTEVCQRICLLLVGESNIKQALDMRIDTLCANKPIQIIRRYKFVPDNEVPTYFQLADIVMAPYQRHVGMSGILLNAAAAGTPVLSSDYGLMGEMARRYGLGLTVESTDPEALAQGLMQCLTAPREQISDAVRMQQFAEQNTAEQFASVVFQYLSSSSGVEPTTPVVSESRR